MTQWFIKYTAQHSVHRTAGTLRVFWSCFCAIAVSRFVSWFSPAAGNAGRWAAKYIVIVFEGKWFRMIGEKLIPVLEQKFGQGSFSRGTGSKLIVSFAPAHPEVGELKIFDDGNEVIIEIGEITHGHFGSMNANATKEEAEEEVVANVVDFLEDLFAGKYILWRTRQRGAGGWKHVDFLSEDNALSKFEKDAVYFKWSGPLLLGNESVNQ